MSENYVGTSKWKPRLGKYLHVPQTARLRQRGCSSHKKQKTKHCKWKHQDGMPRGSLVLEHAVWFAEHYEYLDNERSKLFVIRLLRLKSFLFGVRR